MDCQAAAHEEAGGEDEEDKSDRDCSEEEKEDIKLDKDFVAEEEEDLHEDKDPVPPKQASRSTAKKQAGLAMLWSQCQPCRLLPRVKAKLGQWSFCVHL